MIQTIGRSTVHHIDCMQYMRSCKENQFDLAIVDPPYFSGPELRQYYGKKVSSRGVSRVDYEKMNTWSVPTQGYFDELIRISKHQIIWGINYYNIKNIGPGRIIWDKVNGASTFSDAEIAYCSLYDSTRLFPFMWNGMQQGSGAANGRVMQGNKSLNEKRIHPTQKPVALYDWLLSKYAKPGNTIFDSHMGSGSIAISCNKLGFDLQACELDPVMYRKACERIRLDSAQVEMFGLSQDPDEKQGLLFV